MAETVQSTVLKPLFVIPRRKLIREALQESGQNPDFFLARHSKADWGEICEEDKQLNDQSLIDGSRLLSAYRTLKNKRIWIITEAKNDQGHRAATTILLPENY